MAERIRLVVFDWAGTTVDHGCFAPVSPFVDALAAHGVTVSVAESRGPMGLDKKDHLRALLALPGAASQWHESHGGADVTEPDVDRIFADMVPLALKSVEANSAPISGLLETVKELRRREIKIGASTGYFAEAAEVCARVAASHGYGPDATFCASDVPAARPAPWMTYRNMEALGVFPPSAVLKVGDTVPDIGEGLNAGCWSAGVAATGNEMGVSEADLAALAEDERRRRIDAVTDKLLDAGAHDVIESVRDVPALIDDIDRRMARGEQP